MKTIIRYEEERLDTFVSDSDGYDEPKLTVADIIRDIGGRDPRSVRVEYAGCGTHTIELVEYE
jgi:hypothetical protein